MNEITLSNDLTKLAFEINGLKSNIGYSFYEIGRRLKIAKETNSGYGEWKKFLELINFSRTQADRLIVVFEEYSNGNLPDVGQIGLSLAYEIATLPEPQKKEQAQRIKEGENVPVREIQELKRQNKEQEKQLEQKDELIENMADSMHDFELQARELEGEVQRLKSKPPKTVEVPPADYHQVKQENEQLKQTNQQLQKDLKWVQDDLKMKQTQYQLLESSSAKAKELERKIHSLQSQEKSILEKMQAVDDFHELEKEFNQFFDSKMAPMRFKGIANHLYATNAVDRIRSMITQAELWAEEMNKILPNKNIKIVEGEIIDG